MRYLIRARVEIMIIARLVDADAPEDDRRMIPIAADHLLDITHAQVFPRLIADVLPAGYLFKHQQPKLVAGIEEMRRLRIVRCADDVALQFFFEDPRIAALNARRHGLADKRERLMPIEAAQLNIAPVQIKTLRRKARFTEANPRVVMIEAVSACIETRLHLVELRTIQVP
jgi:hypothetical protein